VQATLESFFGKPVKTQGSMPSGKKPQSKNKEKEALKGSSKRR